MKFTGYRRRVVDSPPRNGYNARSMKFERFSSSCILALLYLLRSSSYAFAAGDQENLMQTQRPIWVYGAPSWGGGDYPASVLGTANRYMVEKFGHTFAVSCIPDRFADESSHIKALSTLFASGIFPDVIRLGRYDQQSKNMFADLAHFEKIMQLDKYFHDPDTYPQLALSFPP